MIETGNLEDLRLAYPVMFGQGAKVPCRQMSVAILDEVQVLDEVISSRRFAAHKPDDLLQGPPIKLPPLRRSAHLTAPAT
jgi:hypothetical protein